METRLNATYLEELTQNGAVYLHNVTADSEWLKDLSILGKIMPTGNQSIRIIKPSTSSTKRSFSLSFDELNPHTEAPYLTKPPRYLVLHGVKESECGGGLTTYCDIRPLLDNLPDEIRDNLTTKEYAFLCMDRQGNTIPGGIQAPILTHRKSLSPILRFSENLIRYGQYCIDDYSQPTADISSILLTETIAKLYRLHSTAIQLAHNDLLILDNYRMLHARSAFKDHQRFLEAVWIEEE
jgi:alpha-ketoglutarate-dependent taurine dioxygenase